MPESFPFRREPCAECPWRCDVEPGKFPPERFRVLAKTAYDMSQRVFGCHMAKGARPFACAGWLLKASAHSLTIRMAIVQGTFAYDDVRSDVPLRGSYRELAIANGVDPAAPELRRCRDDAAVA